MDVTIYIPTICKKCAFLDENAKQFEKCDVVSNPSKYPNANKTKMGSDKTCNNYVHKDNKRIIDFLRGL